MDFRFYDDGDSKRTSKDPQNKVCKRHGRWKRPFSVYSNIKWRIE